MITRTCELAIQILLYLLRCQPGEVLAPARIAGALGASPTYVAKVCGALARAGIVRALRGAKGGVTLHSDPGQLTLLQIVEACQGKLLADYCSGQMQLAHVCNWHRAMRELHGSITEVLGRWTLAELARCPFPTGPLGADTHCRIAQEGFDWLKDLVGPD